MVLQGADVSTVTCFMFVREFGKLQVNISSDAYRSFPEDIRFYPTLLQTKAYLN